MQFNHRTVCYVSVRAFAHSAHILKNMRIIKLNEYTTHTYIYKKMMMMGLSRQRAHVHIKGRGYMRAI